MTSKQNRCPECGLQHQCVCQLLPTIDAPFHLALLTHENELNRATNTGQWLSKSISSTSLHIWQRTQASQTLLALLQDSRYQAYLLFPDPDSISVTKAARISEHRKRQPLFIILDATWQEAKKMLRKSPWLAELPRIDICSTQVSRYQLRRNQQQGHLCTLEVGCELLKQVGQAEQASQLEAFFDHYMQVFKADKSGHAL